MFYAVSVNQSINQSQALGRYHSFTLPIGSCLYAFVKLRLPLSTALEVAIALPAILGVGSADGGRQLHRGQLEAEHQDEGEHAKHQSVQIYLLKHYYTPR